MRELIIYGSGGHAREIAALVNELNAVTPTWSFLGFLDDDAQKHGIRIGDGEVLGGHAWWQRHTSVAVSIAIGGSVARRRVATMLPGAAFATLVHPSAIVGPRVNIGAGSMVCANTVITCDVTIGSHVIINVGATVAHDAALDDFATLAPRVGLAGGTRIGEGTDMGIGSVTIQNVAVGPWSIVGAGATVARDLPANVTAVGVPARVIKTREPGWHDR